MKIVIDIPESKYQEYKNYNGFMNYAEHLIKNGTPIEQEPCEDCVSALNRVMEYTYGMLTAEKAGLQHLIKSMLDELPSVNPQEPKTDVLDKIRAEIIENSIENYKLPGCPIDKLIIETSDILQIIDKYRQEKI